jgi:hypothetical protein
MGDLFGQDRCLARPGPGYDQQRPLAMLDRFLLFLIECQPLFFYFHEANFRRKTPKRKVCYVKSFASGKRESKILFNRVYKKKKYVPAENLP